jgi:hypothetical protein
MPTANPSRQATGRPFHQMDVSAPITNTLIVQAADPSRLAVLLIG